MQFLSCFGWVVTRDFMGGRDVYGFTPRFSCQGVLVAACLVVGGGSYDADGEEQGR